MNLKELLIAKKDLEGKLPKLPYSIGKIYSDGCLSIEYDGILQIEEAQKLARVLAEFYLKED